MEVRYYLPFENHMLKSVFKRIFSSDLKSGRDLNPKRFPEDVLIIQNRMWEVT